MIDTRGNLIEMSKEMQLFNASIVFDHQQTTTEIQRDDFTFFFLEKRFFKHDKTSVLII